MNRKIFCLVLCTFLFALCLSVEAQEPKKVPRIGFLATVSPSTISDRVDAFRQGDRPRIGRRSWQRCHPNNVDRMIATDLNLISGPVLGDGPTSILRMVESDFCHLVVM